MFYDYVADASKAEAVGSDFLSQNGSCYVDVRDLAEAHRLALEKEKAGGERIIINAGKHHLPCFDTPTYYSFLGVFKWQDFSSCNSTIPELILINPNHL